MRKFDTQVQFLKYKVLRETARLALEGHADGKSSGFAEDHFPRQHTVNPLLHL